jgi:hypothetical protein
VNVIRTTDITPAVEGVTSRHNAYVASDKDLPVEDRLLYQSEANILLQRWRADDEVSVAAVETYVRSVTARHDDYVTADEGLSVLERRVYLRSSELLNYVIDEAMEEKEANVFSGLP